MAAQAVPRIDREGIARRSRRAAMIAAIGFVLIAGVIGGSIFEIGRLTTAIAKRHAELGAADLQLKAKQGAIVQAEARLRSAQDALSKTAFQIETGQVNAAKQTLAQSAPLRTAPDIGRVFFQIRSQNQRPIFQTCAKLLIQTGYHVPAVELVPDRGPTTANVRYFHSADRPEAIRLSSVLKQCIGSDISAVSVGGYEGSTLIKPRQFEVWLPPVTGEVSPVNGGL